VNKFRVVNDYGQPLVVYYYDDQRADRIGNEFRAESANGGPIQFFADDRIIESALTTE
jgi:hypothetical protein